jgi:hypothetical protein
MAVDSCSVCLGDDGRVLEHVESNERVHYRPRNVFAASISSHPAFQELSRFLDVSGVSRAETTKLLHICSSFYTRRGDHPCYEGICQFRKRSTGKKPVSFRRSQLRVSKLGLPSLASTSSMGRQSQASVQDFLESLSPILARKGVVLDGFAVLSCCFVRRTETCQGLYFIDFHKSTLTLFQEHLLQTGTSQSRV